MSVDRIRISLDEAHELAEHACLTAGFSPAHAAAIARTVTVAERDEAVSHGLFRIPFYLRALREAGVSPDAEPQFSETAPAILRVDAGYAFAPLALERGTPRLAERTREAGIAALSVVNAYNVAALWPEVERLAVDGLVAMAFTASLSYVAPTGGREPLYGTNPMAFAWPREGRPPLVFDQASSASARGEIQVRMRDGKPIPEGWAVGPDGRPTTDPAAALAGAQLPFGGHKGSSIALMIELLAGALLGDLFSFEATEVDSEGTGVPRGGELVIAMAPERFAPDGNRAAHREHAERLFERVLAQEGTRMPADRRYAARNRSEREGVWIPRAFYEELRSLAR